MARATGAIVAGCAPVQTDSMSELDLERAFDVTYKPEIVLADKDTISGPGWTLSAIPTPGHAADHLAFELIEEKSLFSGDVVMAWSSTIVSPPDGNMAAYLDTLDRLAARTELVYWPGHGGPVKHPQRFSAALAAHRRGREQAIVAFLAPGDASLETITSHLYGKIGKDLAWAARQTVIAHIEHLLATGIITETKPQVFAAAAP
jgi:glyoxylase-like metal-dependent hydrolase (beta-lactamase superfamily II)